MTKYINREELKEMLRREWTKYVPTELDPSIAYVLAKIDELPSIDIVFCKDCKRNADNGGLYDDFRTKCPIQEHYALLKDGFCHLGERIGARE